MNDCGFKVVSAKRATEVSEEDQGCWDVLDVVLDVEGEHFKGRMLFEIDGRDLEFENFPEGFLDRIDTNYLWDDEKNTEVIEKALQECYEATNRY